MANLPDGLKFWIWRPNFSHWIPPGMRIIFLLWTLFYYLNVFRNKEYAVVYIIQKDQIIHRSCVVPSYFRWPFMDWNDLQICSVWSDPALRGNGLAAETIAYVVTSFALPGRTFWYLTREANKSSIRVCEKTGFRRVGTAKRLKRFHLKLFGYFNLKPDNDKHMLCA
jgi:hypothetical protein